MNDFAVTIEDIKKIETHPNAHSLEIATVRGWQTIIPKGAYSVGDLVVYFPIDSILTPAVENKLFSSSSKIKLTNRRIKSIRIRGFLSQGMVASLNELGIKGNVLRDVTKELGITKHEPPAIAIRTSGGIKYRRYENTNFKEYQKPLNIKNVPDIFSLTDFVTVSEKIHGSNFRAGWVKYQPQTWWDKIKKWLRLTPEWEFVYGSHHVQYSRRKDYSGWYKDNIYKEMIEKYNLEKIIPKDTVIYGEIYGDGVQKNFAYGCKSGERKLILFDVTVHGEYMSQTFLNSVCSALQIPSAPHIESGLYNPCMLKHATGKSLLCAQNTREGVVIKSFIGGNVRKLVKVINPAYYDLDTTDFH